MSFKKIELEGLHPANPLHQVIDDVNYNIDALVSALDGLNGGSGVVGPQGPKGDTGAQGPAGIQGPQGEKGDTGESGPAGQDGTNGINGADGKDGAQGPQGLKGDKGDTGDTGPAGVQGIQGPAGKDGNASGPYLVSTNAVGDEGGEIQLAKPPNGSLSGGITIDAYQNKLRIFEQGGTARGVSIDLSKAPAGVAGEVTWKVAGYVDAGQFITMDNLKFTVTTGGSRGLSCATVSGTSMLAISGSYALCGGSGGNATNWSAMPTYTTTPSGSWFGWSFPNAGDASTYNIQEVGTTTRRFYRVTLMIGPGYAGNFICIERLY